jgi:hypothetical protein
MEQKRPSDFHLAMELFLSWRKIVRQFTQHLLQLASLKTNKIKVVLSIWMVSSPCFCFYSVFFDADCLQSLYCSLFSLDQEEQKQNTISRLNNCLFVLPVRKTNWSFVAFFHKTFAFYEINISLNWKCFFNWKNQLSINLNICGENRLCLIIRLKFYNIKIQRKPCFYVQTVFFFTQM